MGAAYAGHWWKQAFAEGARWGRMMVERAEWVSKLMIVEDHIGRKVERMQKVMQYTLRCECGRSVKILQTLDMVRLNVRRRWTDCGCGLGTYDNGKARQTLTLPTYQARDLRLYANAEGLKISLALVKWCEDYEQPWDWRRWNGEDDLPEPCWKYQIGNADLKVVFTVTMPSKMKLWFQKAARKYGTNVGRIARGLVEWRIEQEREREALASGKSRPKIGSLANRRPAVAKPKISEVLEVGESEHLAGASEV